MTDSVGSSAIASASATLGTSPSNLATNSPSITLVVVCGVVMAALAIGWAILRIRTGIKVRELAGGGFLDTRDLGVGARYYAPILVLAALVALLSWLSVRTDGLVTWLCVAGILLSAYGIGRLRIAGFRSRQLPQADVGR